MRVILIALALSSLAAAQDRYAFSVDQDHLTGAPDFSRLNHPIAAADRVFTRDGHFYTVGADLKPNTADDQRLRLFGVNTAFGANFPEPQDAPRIARGACGGSASTWFVCTTWTPRPTAIRRMRAAPSPPIRIPRSIPSR